MITLSALLLAMGIALVFVGLASITSLDRALAGRLRHYAMSKPVAIAPVQIARRHRLTGDMSDQLNRAIRNHSFVASLHADLARANLKLTTGEFLLGQAAFMFAFMLIGYNMVAVVARPNLLAIPVFGFLGFLLPKVWVARRAAARLRAFNDQLPDTMSLMSNALRSGMSLLQAMDLVAREAAPPMSEEFARVVREIGLGLAPEDALRHLSRRIQSEDLRLLVAAINVQHEVGGNLAGLLDSIADTIRERVQLKGEVRTLTTQQRVSGYILALMPVIAALLLVLVNFEYMSPLFGMPFLLMPIVAAINVVIGVIVIQKIINGIEM
jgi:tight adherence protein B